METAPATTPPADRPHGPADADVPAHTDVPVHNDVPPRDPADRAAELCTPLAELVDTLRASDRLAAKAVRLLSRLQESGECEATTGLPVELWLAGAARRTRSDRRMLETAADTLRRLPAVADAFDRGLLSWSQVRAIALKCERLPKAWCRVVDDALAPHVQDLSDAEPDALLHLISQALASMERPSEKPSTGPRDRFLHLQPTLEGGGRIFGDLDALAFGVVDRATDPGPPPTTDPDVPVGRTQGRRRADQLVDILARSLAASPRSARSNPANRDGHDGHPFDDDEPEQRGGGPASGPSDRRADAPTLPIAPTLLINVDLTTLLGLGDTHAEVLTTLTGGRMRVDADTLRRLVDQGGAAARAIVFDDVGRVVGVGRRTRIPRAWMRDAILARDAVCAEPCCERSATICDVDHVRPWNRDGTTDLSNLQPLCTPSNRSGPKDAWQVTALDDGTRRWTHRNTGLSMRTVPASRRLRIQAPDGDDPPPDADAHIPF